jgi:hypothetical protein
MTGQTFDSWTADATSVFWHYRMWRTHSCVPRRDFLDACQALHPPRCRESLDTARTSAYATSLVLFPGIPK